MKLSLIIVNYNTQDHLRNALESIEKYVLPKLGKQVETFVVDNASIDGSKKMVKQAFPFVKLLALDTNVGYAQANNLAMKSSMGKYVMLLNSDAQFTEMGTIETLLAYMDEHQEVAVITPKVVLDSGELDWACHRGFPTPWNAFTYFSGLQRIIPVRMFSGYHMKYEDLTKIHAVDACTGAAMLVRRKAIADVGMFDERFFMYAEDIDWCYRFKEKGWGVVYHPSVVVLHHKHQSGKKHGSKTVVGKQTNRAFYDTMIQFYEKHYAQRYPRIVMWLVRLGIKILKVVKGV